MCIYMLLKRHSWRKVMLRTHMMKTYGVRRVQFWIQRNEKKHVNRKAIHRMMRKLNLLSMIRRSKAYTRYQQAAHKYPNLLNTINEQIPKGNQKESSRSLP